MSKQRYRPRNDFVLFSIHDEGKVGSIAMPNIAAQGKRYVVEAVGQEVKDLKPGDEIITLDAQNSVAQLVNERNLYLTRQANVICVIEQVDDDLSEPA